MADSQHQDPQQPLDQLFQRAADTPEEQAGLPAIADELKGINEDTISPEAAPYLQAIKRLPALAETLKDKRIQEEAAQFLQQRIYQCLVFIMAGHDVARTKSVLDYQIKFFEYQIENTNNWPTTPHDDAELYEGLPEVLYYHHNTEGRLKLQWSNPLPCLSFYTTTYRCDACETQGIIAGYQNTDCGDVRDDSSFHLGRVGWDVCAPCAREILADEAEKFRALIQSTCNENKSYRMCRSPLYEKYVLNVTDVYVDNNSGSATLGIECTPLEHLVCVVYPLKRIQDEDIWKGDWKFASSRELFCPDPEQEDCTICMDSLTDGSDGKIRPVRTLCGHWFHEACVRKFIRGHSADGSNNTCPLCRHPNPFPEIPKESDGSPTQQTAMLSGCEEETAMAIISELVDHMSNTSPAPPGSPQRRRSHSSPSPPVTPLKQRSPQQHEHGSPCSQYSSPSKTHIRDVTIVPSPQPSPTVSDKSSNASPKLSPKLQRVQVGESESVTIVKKEGTSSPSRPIRVEVLVDGADGEKLVAGEEYVAICLLCAEKESPQASYSLATMAPFTLAPEASG